MVAILGLVVDFVLIWALYGSQLRGVLPPAPVDLKIRVHRPLLIKSSVAAASTLAGNLTPLGSIANLIVIEQARRAGVEMSFWSYVRLGVPVTILTLTVAVAALG